MHGSLRSVSGVSERALHAFSCAHGAASRFDAAPQCLSAPVAALILLTTSMLRGRLLLRSASLLHDTRLGALLLDARLRSLLHTRLRALNALRLLHSRLLLNARLRTLHARRRRPLLHARFLTLHPLFALARLRTGRHFAFRPARRLRFPLRRLRPFRTFRSRRDALRLAAHSRRGLPSLFFSSRSGHRGRT